MKLLLSLIVVLLLAAQSGAETYSWVDDSGTYNFTEEFSNVPAKYRNKVNRLDDMGKDSVPPAPAPPESKPAVKEAPAVKPAAPVEDKHLYNGKTLYVWRAEMEAQEVELKKLEQRMDMLQKDFYREPRLPAAQLKALSKENEDIRLVYDQKYKVYTDLIESARKAGLTVDMKK